MLTAHRHAPSMTLREIADVHREWLGKWVSSRDLSFSESGEKTMIPKSVVNVSEISSGSLINNPEEIAMNGTRCMDGAHFINLNCVSGPVRGEEGRLYRLESGQYMIISGETSRRDMRPLTAQGGGVYLDEQHGSVWEEFRVPVPGWTRG